MAAKPESVEKHYLPGALGSPAISSSVNADHSLFTSQYGQSAEISFAHQLLGFSAHLVFMIVWFCPNSSVATLHVLVGPPKRKRFARLESRIFPVIKCKPAFGQRSTKRAAIGIILEPQSFERAEKLGRYQLDNEAILVAVFLGGNDFCVNRCHTANRFSPSVAQESLSRLLRSFDRLRRRFPRLPGRPERLMSGRR